jgi:hypothetical protein
MSVSIPQPFRTRIVSPVTVNGIPDTFTIHVGTLPTITLNVEHLPAIHLSIDHIPKVQLGVDPVELRLTEFPSIRGHLPADFCVGLSLLGLELAQVRLCGEAQIITEPYKPNPCEVCGPAPPPPPTPAPPAGIAASVPAAAAAQMAAPRRAAAKRRGRKGG